MAAADNSLYYSVALGVLFTAAYSLSNLNFETIYTGINSVLGLSRTGKHENVNLSPDPVDTDVYTTTPEDFLDRWTDEEVFQLERRAIFSKTWLYLTHSSNFRNPGDYRTFEIAGFSIIVIRGKDNQIRAFHNVCRHRAYAVTKKECGSSTVLRCRYHGWSYDSKGKLIKAPEFENVKGFEKDLNGLWEVRTEIRESMIFVNLDSGNEVTSQALSGIDGVLRRWGINNMALVAEWRIEGSFNWKLASGSLSLGEPRKARFAVLPMLFSSREYLDVFDTVLFCRLSSSHVMTVRLLPVSRGRTMFDCSVYGVSTNFGSAIIHKVQKEIHLTIQGLELRQNSLVHGGTQISNLKWNNLKERLQKHKLSEESLGTEIHPAARKQSFTEEGREDDKLCRDVEEDMLRQTSICSANASGLLDW